MANLNKVTLQGNITRDVESRTTNTGKQVASFTIAVNGRTENDTTFVDVTAWDKTAENVSKHKKKGDPVIVAGRLVTEKWEDKKSGEKRSKLSVVAEDVYFLSGKKEGAPAKSENSEEGDSDIPF
jgi:single-strand DNA-binding protein